MYSYFTSYITVTLQQKFLTCRHNTQDRFDANMINVEVAIAVRPQISTKCIKYRSRVS
jgi:hypothetical protein